jgi:hypothetical protein
MKLYLLFFLLLLVICNCSQIFYYSNLRLEEQYISNADLHFSINDLIQMYTVIECEKWNKEYNLFYHNQISISLLKKYNNVNIHNHLIIAVNNKEKQILITTNGNHLPLKEKDECNMTLPFLNDKHCVYYSLYNDVLDLYKYNSRILKKVVGYYPKYKIIMIGKNYGDTVLKLVSIFLKEECNINVDYFYSFNPIDIIGNKVVDFYISNAIHYKYRIIETTNIDINTENKYNFVNVNIGYNNSYKICDNLKNIYCLDRIYPIRSEC